MVALEIRGISNKLRLIMDAPLDRVFFVKFEAVELMANDHTMRRPKSSFVDPTDTFDYMPNSEAALYKYNVPGIEMEVAEEELEVVPYEQYKKEIKRSLKPTFYGWSSLLILRLHNCHLDQLDAEVFDDLSALIHLSLDHNQIKVIPAFVFYGIPNLRTLSLAHNEILDLHYRDLAGLLSLRHLDLSYNNLTKLSESTFPPLPKLESLDLRFNGIRHIFAYTFDVMNTTQSLRLGDSEVEIDLTQSENAFDSLHQLTELQILNASHPRFDERIFNGLVNLRTLKMRGNFPELTFDSFGSIPNVTEMTIAHCNVTELSMDTFYGTELLQVIDLSHNRLAYLPPNLFDRQFQLRELHLQNNQLTQLPNSFFAHTRAKAIRLTDNPWVCTCEMLRTWKQGVTNARIKRRKERHCQRAFNEVFDDLEEEEEDSGLCKEKIVYEAVYDNKLSPRCDGGPANVKGRAVYYAYRKELKCKSLEEDLTDGRMRQWSMKGVGQVKVHVSEDTWQRSQHVRKMRIMQNILARKKQVEKEHFRHTNSLSLLGQRRRAPHSLPRWQKRSKLPAVVDVVNVEDEEEDEEEISNQLEL